MSPQARLPRGRLILWALLVPLAYAPSFVIGGLPTTGQALSVVAAAALAFSALAALFGGDLLDRAESRLGRGMPFVLALFALLYTAISAATAHARLMAVGDYSQSALYGQSFWTLLHGLPFANTHETLDGSLGSHFGIHFSPTLLLLAPFYRLWPDPLVLLVFQALAIALIPVPVYALLAPRVGRVGAALFGLAVVAMTGLWWAGPTDFFDANFLPVLVLAMVWAVERRRWGWFIAFALAALGVREEFGVTMVLLGVWALFTGRGGKVSLAIAALGIAWFAVVVTAVIPKFSSPGMWMDPKRFFVSMFGQWGATPAVALEQMLTHPGQVLGWLAARDNVVFLHGLLRPYLFLPPLADWASLPALPGLGVILLSRLGFMKETGSHYANLPATFLALGTLYVAMRVVGRAEGARRTATGLALAVIVLAGTLPSLAMTSEHVASPAPPADATARVARLIPPGAPVYATVKLYPRLCNRNNFGCWWSTYEWGREPEFRGRYRFIVLWPDGDPDRSRDAPLADSLAHDARFVERAGYEPFVVYERR